MSHARFSSSEYYGLSEGANIVEEIVDGNHGYARGPERALLSALLFDGIQAYMAYALHERGQERGECKEAYLWVHTAGSDYVFSFESVCEALGIDPDYLRLGLANAVNSAPGEWKRARRNF